MKNNMRYFRKLLKSSNKKIQCWNNQKVWILGASSGIGFSLASLLLERGAKVALTGRTYEPMHLLSQKFLGKALVEVADVRKTEQLARALDRIISKWGSIDLVVYLAASYTPLNTWQLDSKIAKDTVDVNLSGFLNVVALVLPMYFKNKSGGIVVVSSVAGYRGLPNASPYGATKAALINLAETMYLDMCNDGVSVYLVNPGFVETQLSKKNRFSMPMIISPEEAAHQIIKGIEKGQFEIHFPKAFTLIFKALAVLPYRIYFCLISMITKT